MVDHVEPFLLEIVYKGLSGDRYLVCMRYDCNMRLSC